MNLSMLQIAWRLGVKRGAHSWIGKFCVIYTDTKIQISTKSERKCWTKKFLFGRKSHGSIVITTLQVHISADLALELFRKELKMLFT